MARPSSLRDRPFRVAAADTSATDEMSVYAASTVVATARTGTARRHLTSEMAG
jgi:hypothetical protein